MSTRLEVQSAIEQLPKGEIRDLSKWLQEYLDEEWDLQIEADFGAGKLDRLIAKAESDIANNNVRNLDEVIQTDPDVGLEVNPAVIEQLLAIRQSKSPTLTTDEVKKRLGLIEDEHPMLKFAGIFKDDSDFDAVVANIEKDRSTNIEK
jgi:hypothetical protein